MNKEAQDFERWLREKIRTLFTNTLDESKVVEADPPKDERVIDANKLIKEANTEEK